MLTAAFDTPCCRSRAGVGMVTMFKLCIQICGFEDFNQEKNLIFLLLPVLSCLWYFAFSRWLRIDREVLKDWFYFQFWAVWRLHLPDPSRSFKAPRFPDWPAAGGSSCRRWYYPAGAASEQQAVIMSSTETRTEINSSWGGALRSYKHSVSGTELFPRIHGYTCLHVC